MRMIVDFLPELLRLNLVTSIVILIILGARLILKRAPKVFSYALWAIVLIRLLIPVSIQSPISVVPNTPAATGAVINSALPEIEFETLRDREQNYYESQNTSPEDVQVYVSRTVEPMVYLSLTWLVGVAVMVLYSGISYLKIKKKVRIAVPLRENIWIADDINRDSSGFQSFQHLYIRRCRSTCDHKVRVCREDQFQIWRVGTTDIYCIGQFKPKIFPGILCRSAYRATGKHPNICKAANKCRNPLWFFRYRYLSAERICKSNNILVLCAFTGAAGS